MPVMCQGIKSINVGIIGLGTVGKGVYRLLTKNSREIEKKLGIPVKIVKIADIDISKGKDAHVPDEILTTDATEVITHPDIHILVELMGGTGVAGEFLMAAAKAGKCVVTANKALLAEKGHTLVADIESQGMEIGFEASVGGGIPVLKSLRESLAGNRIQEIFGIMNGTSNYILTRMSDEGMKFEDALKEAQKSGLAEADPTLDVDGIDTAHKLAILIWIATGKAPLFADIYTEGIRNVTPMDMEFSREFGYQIKLLAISKISGEGVEARVHPTMVPRSHLISTVGGAYNAIHVTGDFAGPILLYGSGAGMDPTASAVVGDIIEIARNLKGGIKRRLPFSGWDTDGTDLKVKKMEDVVSEYYLGFTVIDKPGVLSKISGVLGDHDISISSMIQKGRKKERDVPIVILTHEAREKDIDVALKKIDTLDVVRSATRRIRIENNL